MAKVGFMVVLCTTLNVCQVAFEVQ
jgi:hypothetical protein